MRWPWRRWEDDPRRAHLAAKTTQLALEQEQLRLAEAEELAQSLANHRKRNRFAEAMRIALGGRP